MIKNIYKNLKANGEKLEAFWNKKAWNKIWNKTRMSSLTIRFQDCTATASLCNKIRKISLWNVFKYICWVLVFVILLLTKVQNFYLWIVTFSLNWLWIFWYNPVLNTFVPSTLLRYYMPILFISFPWPEWLDG